MNRERLFLRFLKTQIIEIMIFLTVFSLGAILSYIYSGGPKTLSAPTGVVIGFIIIQFFAYRNFKKEWNKSNGFNHTRK